MLGSPPARGRGLKLFCLNERGMLRAVAPRAGAWIETGKEFKKNQDKYVAPRAGAWIETCATPSNCQKTKRRPPRGGVD